MLSITTCFLLQGRGGGDAGSHATELSHSPPKLCLAFLVQRKVGPAQCPGYKTLSRSAIFLSDSRRQVISLVRCSQEEKALRALPLTQLCHVPGASQPEALLIALSLSHFLPHSSATTLVRSDNTQCLRPFCGEDKGMKMGKTRDHSLREDPARTWKQSPQCASSP